MTRNLGMMAGLLVLAACGEKGGSDAANGASDTAPAVGASGPGQTANIAKTMGVNSFEKITMEKCTGVEGIPVIWKLSNIFDKLKDKNELKRDIKRGIDEVYEVDQGILGDNWPTSVDMDVSSPLPKPTPLPDYVIVTIELLTGRDAGNGKPGVYFLRPSANARPDNPPFTAGNTDHENSEVTVMIPAGTGSHFCGRTNIDIKPGKESVTFGIKRDGQVYSLNVGLLVPAEPKNNSTKVWLPIFLDPNVRNQG
jgi:hypothetical protein